MGFKTAKTKERDRIGTSNLGLKVVTSGIRTVRNNSVSINGEKFYVAGFSKSLDGMKVRIAVADYLATEYDVLDIDDYHQIGTAAAALRR